MPKAKKTRKPADPQHSDAIRRLLIHFTLALLFAGGIVAGVHFARQYVGRKLAFPSEPPKVVFKNRPAWMSDLLAEEIVRAVRPAGTHSAFDRQLLVDVGSILQASPWIRHVKQIRRVYENAPGDTIEIDCDYRDPVALVQWGDYFWLVDGEGVKLPAQFTADQLPRVVLGADHRMNMRVIKGVSHPPVESGRKWPGEDLEAGLDLARLLYGQDYAEQIVQIDVANFGGRVSTKEAQLVLGTRYDTEIRWGRPINSKRDFFVEVSTQHKIDSLKQIYQQYHRIDADQKWIDIRFDKITYPSPDPALAGGQ